jgi:hypothetical protein
VAPITSSVAVSFRPFSIDAREVRARSERLLEIVGTPLRDELRRLGDDATKVAMTFAERASGPLRLIQLLHTAVAEPSQGAAAPPQTPLGGR